MLIRVPKGWEIPEREATPENAYLNRRQLLAAASMLGAERLVAASADGSSLYPAKRNAELSTSLRITEEWAAAGYNNYYEFHPTNKEAVKDRVGKFVISPWKIHVSGLVHKSQTLDFDTLVRQFPLEERVYRFRCVEAWAMQVPWTGFPLASLVKFLDPKPEAKFIRFETVNRPDQMPGMREASWYPWPYFEGLRMDEAMNPLTLVVTGMYGKPIPKQNGAPIRIITPWKYGYKSPKSIVKIEFISKEPRTFWNQLQSSEYGFYSNVDPTKPHPRWSQATEKELPTMAPPTLMYNGYEKWVAGLYNGKEF